MSDKSPAVKAPAKDADLFKWAEFYLALGCSVIPLREGKLPAVQWKEFQERRADRVELMKWFAGSGWGMALVCGKVSGNLVRIDFDEPADYLELKSKLPIAPTFKSQRKGGGYGMLLRSTELVPLLPQKTFKDYPKLEIRGEGGITVVPPTPGYDWIGQIVTIKETDVPDMLKRLFGFDLHNRDKFARSVETSAGNELATLLKETAEGERSNNLVRIAGMLRARGIDMETALDVMQHNFEDYWPHEGMDWAEAQATFEKAWKRYEHEGVRVTAGGKVGGSAWADEEDDDEVVVQHLSEIKKKTEEETVLIEKVVCAGEMGNTVIAAPAKVGKTSLCLDMSITASRGDLVWGGLRVMRALRIAYIDQERKAGQILENKDIMTQVIGEPNDSNLIILTQKSGDFNIGHQKTLSRLYDTLKDFDPDLVILDGWAWMCQDPSDPDKVRKALSWLKKTRQELDCASIIIHHFKKSQTQFGTSGSNGEFIDMLDQIGGMKRLSDQAHTALVYVPINNYDTFNVLSGRTNKPSWDPPKTVIDYDHMTLTHKVITAEEGMELFDAETYRNLWGTASAESRQVKGMINVIKFRFGISQAELASRLGVTQSVVSKWYSGQQNPSKEIMKRLEGLYVEAKQRPTKASKMPRPAKATKGLGDR